MDCGRRFCLAGGLRQDDDRLLIFSLAGSELVSVLQMDWNQLGARAHWETLPLVPSGDSRPDGKTSTGSHSYTLDASCPEGREKVVQLFGYRKAGAGWSSVATEVLRPRN